MPDELPAGLRADPPGVSVAAGADSSAGPGAEGSPDPRSDGSVGGPLGGSAGGPLGGSVGGPLGGSVGGPLGLLSSSLRVESVIALLHEVIDPELGVNIVDLGLLRQVEVAEDDTVHVEMTLTTPGCPLGGYIEDEIRGCMAQLPQVRDVAVKIVWEPPWGPEQMTDRAREQLGWL